MRDGSGCEEISLLRIRRMNAGDISSEGRGRYHHRKRVRFIENGVGIFLVVSSEICHCWCVISLFGVIACFLLLLIEFTGSRCQMNE